MRHKSGPAAVSHRCRTTRRRSVVRRYLSCLRHTTGGSDTDSEYDTQLSSLLDHQSQPAGHQLEQEPPITASCQATNDAVSVGESSAPIERHHLQLPTFRGRRQRWHTSFGQYQDLMTSLTANVTSSRNDADDLLADSVFASLFDSCADDVTPRCHDNEQCGDVVEPTSDSDSVSSSLAQQSVTSCNDSREHDDVQSSRDVVEPTDDSNNVSSSLVQQTIAIICDDSSCLTQVCSSEPASSSTTSSASSHRVLYYYDRRLRPVSRSLVCPPAYDDIEPPPTDNTLFTYCQQLPPPPYAVTQDLPPAYSDVIESASDWTGLNTNCSAAAPFTSRLAVRWNRNMSVERWASSVNWITSS